MKELMKCNLCPRNCNVNRNLSELGFCKASNKLKVARYSLHKWEEPCISGNIGSGTIFFSHCNLKCIFCQNYDISTENLGKEISIDEMNSVCTSPEDHKTPAELIFSRITELGDTV